MRFSCLRAPTISEYRISVKVGDMIDYHPESLPEFNVSVGFQDSGESGHRGTESPPDFCSCGSDHRL